jgi:Fe(3+) dicitrate transport protein
MKNIRKILSVLGISLCIQIANAQVNNDSTPAHVQYAASVTVVGLKSKKDIHFLPEIVGTNINAGKKNNLIVLDNVKGNTVNNTMRQVIAKVPGVHIWESDGSGIQIGIAARGLSPNRSWEFNVRQNGSDISADPFGYPEAYYNPQLQAVQRVEILRGQAALQYGAQFGGMVNYILKDGSNIKKPIEIETQNSIGSNQLFNNYTAIGGTYKKFNYYTFFDHRNSNGWRNNSKYATNNYSGSVTYQINEKAKLSATYTHSQINSQQPGGLTDIQVLQNATQSFRNRNWMDITWNTAAVQLDYNLTKNTKFKINAFSVIGKRNSVGYIQPITIRDTINAATLQYNNRTVDIDEYTNLGIEARLLHQYKLGNALAHLSGGIRAYTGTTNRYRNGKGTTESNYDITIVNNVWPTHLNFKSVNYAAFAENVFRKGKKLLIIPGVRLETIQAKVSGQNGLNGTVPILLIPQQKQRSFLLGGVNAEYHVAKNAELYGGIAQAYRPIQFADLITPPTTDVVDPNIKDANGYNLDFGYRGVKSDWLTFDASLYYMYYTNRIGTITQQRTDGTFYNYRTNVGTSISKGVESMVDVNVLKLLKAKTNYELSLFASYAFTEARYQNLIIISKSSSNQLVQSNLKNKFVENAPQHIIRSGVSLSNQYFNISTQLSHTSKSFADANNTVLATANAQNGIIPAYTIIDIYASVKLPKQINVKLNVNNIANITYFTRRASGYPGPGALPADGRTLTLTVGVKI